MAVWKEVEMRSSVIESSKAETATEIESSGTVLALIGRLLARESGWANSIAFFFDMIKASTTSLHDFLRQQQQADSLVCVRGYI
jgi:hypothetical protein